MQDAPDAHVMAASLEEPARFGEIFDRHAAVVLGYLARRLGPDPAEGILAECFRIAFERRASFDPEATSARPWLFGIASNLLRKHRRSEARRLRATARLLQEQAAPLPVEAGTVSQLDRKELWPRVADAISALPEHEREALLLFAWEELPYQEVAQTLGVKVGTVRSRIHRARERLRATPGLPTLDESDELSTSEERRTR